MINSNMRNYDYWKITLNEEYQQEVIPAAETPTAGKVKLSIYPTSTGTQDNILYSNCAYIGLTFDADIDETYIIQYEKERLKVKYKQPYGRYKQVYLQKVE